MIFYIFTFFLIDALTMKAILASSIITRLMFFRFEMSFFIWLPEYLQSDNLVGELRYLKCLYSTSILHQTWAYSTPFGKSASILDFDEISNLWQKTKQRINRFTSFPGQEEVEIISQLLRKILIFFFKRPSSITLTIFSSIRWVKFYNRQTERLSVL